MPDTLEIGIQDRPSFDDAVGADRNVIQKHLQWTGLGRFLQERLSPKHEVLERLVAFQMGIGADRVKVRPKQPWLLGGFNVAVAMLIDGGRRPDRTSDANDAKNAGDVSDATGAAAGSATATKSVPDVLVRCPLPSKCAEHVYPGSIEEKMRGEVAAYVWMQRHCPDVRIPFLYGFAFPGGQHFAHCSRVPFLRRAWLRVRQFVAARLHRPVPSDYLPLSVPSSVFSLPASVSLQQKPGPVEFGYMILEFLHPSLGRQLPYVIRNRNLQDELQNTPGKVDNLFRSVGRIMLALARVPQPRIGSLSFHDDGTVALDHRPLCCDMILLENEGAPRTMGPTQTYLSESAFVADLLAFHDAQFLAAPNAAHDQADFVSQTDIRAFFRAIVHHFLPDTETDGARPYVLQFTDDNAANMMVDDDWNVTAIFDLEWLIAGPIDMLAAPRWLTWTSIDCIIDNGYDEYDQLRRYFMQLFRDEEEKAATTAVLQHTQDNHRHSASKRHPLADAMQDNWATERLWIYRAAMSVNALHHVVRDRLVPLFYRKQPLPNDLYRSWHPAVEEILEAKLRDRRAYVGDLARLYGREPPPEE
ncbi:hypothetical protein SPI_03516 [Niveomyces insectorum RCEF 264]|uniref:Aminoglycoside phosphotransferase n=1 Tax=Niveomyces insectorum RCEF 264 TaxID=1081102 RepID=A0A167W566_9HYPO|nr:hypothetical protein SPI_03516 [Niveomyces insectorum RCEF 264]